MKNRKFIIALIATSYIAYIFSIYQAYPLCLGSRYVDPLFTVHALFPSYYIAILLFALACLVCYFLNIRNKCVHIVFLTQFALMLWFTPYYLAGFVREPDGIWHVGISLSIPEIMQGEHVDFSGYALSHPGSFIWHYIILEIMGINPKIYIGLLYPVICVFLIILLWHTFIHRLFGLWTAFLGTLIAIPGLHYIKLHPSPQTLGFALLLSSVIFIFTKKNRNALASGLISSFSAVIVHPESPVIIILFLIAALITSSILKDIEETKTGIILIISCIFWFSWHLFWATGTLNYIVSRVYDILALRFVKGFEVAQKYVFGTPFIYKEIYIINQAAYFSYLVIVAFIVSQVLFSNLILLRKIKAALTYTFKKLGYNGTTMTLSLFMLVVFTFSITLFGSPALIERGITILILVASAIIASQISLVFRPYSNNETRIPKINKKLGKYVAISLTIFFITTTLIYPIISYSIDAYLNYPPSEDFGLKFLSTKISLNGTKVAMSFPEHLALYKSNLGLVKTINLHFSKPADLNKSQPNVFVFRITGYYYAAMRLDISFEHDRFYNYSTFLVSRYIKVYSNPAFDVWIKP